MIEFDDTKKIEWSPTMAARITRPRAVKILGLIAEAREVIIQTHPEPEVVRAVYDSDWFMRLVYAEPEIIDPNGTIRFLHKIDELFAELGLEEGEPVTDLPDAESELSPGGEGSEAD